MAAFDAAGTTAHDAVYFSSTAAVWSQSGAGHYAAANCALDGLAQRRHHMGLPTTALQLGPFRGAGMAAQHVDALAALGLRSLQPHEVRRRIALMLKHASSAHSQRTVFPGLNNDLYKVSKH